MRFLLIFLPIAYAFCEAINKFYNISYNTEYVVDVTQFSSNYIPKANLYFIIPAENIRRTNLQIRLDKGDKIDFKVKVSGFSQLPTESEIVKGTDDTELEQTSISTELNFIRYTYSIPTLKKQDKIKYLVFIILNNETLNYLSLYTYLFKEVGDFTFYDITYKKEELLNETILSRHQGIFLFTLENEEIGKNKLMILKLKEELPQELMVGIAAFKEKPITKEIINNPVSSYELPLKSLKKDENHLIYEFLIEKEEINKEKYLGIAIYKKEVIDFMSLYIGPES